MKKLSILIAVLLLAPQITFAAWWNPLTWFNNWGRGEPQVELRELNLKSDTPVVSSDELDQFIEKEEPRRSDYNFDRTFRNTEDVFLDTTPKKMEDFSRQLPDRKAVVNDVNAWLKDINAQSPTPVTATPNTTKPAAPVVEEIDHAALAKELKAELDQLNNEIEYFQEDYEKDYKFIQSAIDGGDPDGEFQKMLDQMISDFSIEISNMEERRKRLDIEHRDTLRRI